MGKPTMSMATFNSYVSHYQRVYPHELRATQLQLPRREILYVVFTERLDTKDDNNKSRASASATHGDIPP